jgi:hypothetical protein
MASEYKMSEDQIKKMKEIFDKAMKKVLEDVYKLIENKIKFELIMYPLDIDLKSQLPPQISVKILIDKEQYLTPKEMKILGELGFVYSGTLKEIEKDYEIVIY